MPDFSLMDYTPSYGNMTDLQNSTQSDRNASVRAAPQGYGAATTIAGDALLGTMDLVDSVAHSLPGVGRLTGTTRGQITEGMLSKLDMPGLTRFYNENKGGVGVASGIWGVIASELVTRKALAVAKPFIAGLKTTSYARRLASLDDQYNLAVASWRAAEAGIASRGTIPARAIQELIDVPVATWTPAGLSTTLRSVSLGEARRSVRKLGAVQGALRAGASEATLAFTMNSNEFLYSEDWAQNALFAGAGVIAGAAFGRLTSNYAIKKFAASDEITRLRADALDPTGLEQMTVGKIGAVPTNQNRYLGSLQGTRTDEITSLVTRASAAPAPGVDRSTFSQLSTGLLNEAFIVAEKVSQKGITGLADSAFIIGQREGTTPEGRLIKAALKHDEGALFGVEMLGRKDSSMTYTQAHQTKVGAIQKRIDEIEEALADGAIDSNLRGKALKELKQLRFNQKLTPSILTPDGQRMPLSYGKSLDNWEAPKIQENDLAGRKVWNAYDAKDGQSIGIGFDENFTVFFSKNRSIMKLDGIDYLDMMKLHRTAGKAIKDLAPRFAKDPNRVLALGGKPTWFQLDAAENLMQATEGRANINWGSLSREQAQVESFAQKVELLSNMDPKWVKDNMFKVQSMLNLPALTAYEMGLMGSQRHALDVVLRGAIAAGGPDVIRSMNLNDLKGAFAEAKKISDLTQFSAADVKSLTGNSANFMVDEAGQELLPVISYSRSLKPFQWSRDDLADRILFNKFQQAKTLMAPEAGPMTQMISGTIYASPDMQLASRVGALHDVQMTPSLIPGTGNMVPQSQGGALINAATSMEHRARDIPGIQAAMRLHQVAQAQARDYVKQLIQGAMGDRLGALAGPRALQTRTLLDQFYSPGVSGGWDLSEKLVPISHNNGTMYGFTLEDTFQNRDRFKRQFGRAMSKGEPLISPNGTTVVLDEMGKDILERFGQITDAIRIEKNTLLRAQGMNEVRRTNYYVPGPNLENKFVSYTFGPDGKIIQGGTVNAATQAEHDRLVAKMLADPQSVANQPGAIVRGRKEVVAFGSLWDKAQMDLIDSNRTWIQSGKVNVGSSAGPEMVSGSFQSSLESIRNQYLDHANDIIQTSMADQIKGMQLRSQLAAGETKTGGSFFKDVQYRSSYDYWLQALKGQSPLSGPNSQLGAVYSAIESTFNRTMAEAAPTSSKVWHAMTDFLTRRMPWVNSPDDIKAYTQLATHMGKFMPFDDVAKMVENRQGGVVPWTLADATGGANRFAAAWMLRMGEVAHPIMNLSGILSSMPAVVRNFQPNATELANWATTGKGEFAARVGHSATIFQSPSGRVTGVLDMGKLAKRGFENAWKRESLPEYDRLVRKGMMTQEVAELQKQMASLDSPSALKKFFNGDVTISNPKGVKERLQQKGLVGWMSVLSDKSEDFSRSWAHMIGDDLGKQLGIPPGDTLDNFAHDIANKMIANYNPLNRAEVFQGAVGAPFGLFQSYMVNFWQRMFRYVETGDLRSVAVQAATQGSLFGMVAVPGWKEAQKFFFDTSEGERTPLGGLVQNFGPDASDVLMGGTLANIPKLFGAEGANLYSRGDVAARVPIANWPPAVTVIGKIMEGIGNAIDLLADENPAISSQQIGEILSNAIPNRPIAGMVENFMTGGRDVDSMGQLISENKSWMESVYKGIGLRSMRQSKELEVYYMQKQAQEIKASQDEILRESSRSLIRSGREDALPKIWEAYQMNGGDARNFRRWYLDNVEAANETRGSRMLKSLGSLDNIMRDPEKMKRAQLLMDFEVSIQDDDNTADPFETLNVQDPMSDPVTPMATEGDEGLAYGSFNR